MIICTRRVCTLRQIGHRFPRQLQVPIHHSLCLSSHIILELCDSIMAVSIMARLSLRLPCRHACTSCSTSRTVWMGQLIISSGSLWILKHQFCRSVHGFGGGRPQRGHVNPRPEVAHLSKHAHLICGQPHAGTLVLHIPQIGTPPTSHPLEYHGLNKQSGMPTASSQKPSVRARSSPTACSRRSATLGEAAPGTRKRHDRRHNGSP